MAYTSAAGIEAVADQPLEVLLRPLRRSRFLRPLLLASALAVRVEGSQELVKLLHDHVAIVISKGLLLRGRGAREARSRHVSHARRKVAFLSRDTRTARMFSLR